MRPSLAALILALGLSSSAGAQVADQLKCYKVKDSAPKARYSADLTGLAPEPGCLIKVPAKQICIATTKTNVMPPPPGSSNGPAAGRFLCYSLKFPKAAPAAITIGDQFGTRSVQPGVPKTLCAPIVSPSICGNGFVEPDEVCDDGNTVTETGCPYGTPTCLSCSADCSSELFVHGSYCGDGIQDFPQEECDDGSTNNGAATCPYGIATCQLCSATCSLVDATGPLLRRRDRQWTGGLRRWAEQRGSGRPVQRDVPDGLPVMRSHGDTSAVRATV